MAIYTKKGDQGLTNLFGVKGKILKSSKTIEALGALDEANSFLGLLQRTARLEKIQKNLMLISSIAAGKRLKFSKDKTIELEKEINQLEKKLLPLHNFIIPRGKIMFARAIVRRAERSVVGISHRLPRGERLAILAYLNRLSDYLFVLGRRKTSMRLLV